MATGTSTTRSGAHARAMPHGSVFDLDVELLLERAA